MTTTDELTAKQRRVYALLEEGHKPAEIAKRMKITRSGVYGHIRHIRRAGVVLPEERPFTNGEVASPNGEVAVDGVEEMLSVAIASSKAEYDALGERLNEALAGVEECQERQAEAGEQLARYQQALNILRDRD